ncbi:MAG: uncharacterized protein KVP18_000308 [Porospora cf. gigantea A]|uniref:uncharacterized protein n=2 Tax=Porospora cf. gigantea A TaxID=2853593 RepID=UPI00355A3B5C|nr:MAG: hypothetical protein KVP18_000308 [Porospora cf. gigantea A]
MSRRSAITFGALAVTTALAAATYFWVKKIEARGEPIKNGEVSRADLLTILKAIKKTQQDNRKALQALTTELAASGAGLEEACARVSQLPDKDPLTAYGLTVNEFDLLLEKFQRDREVNAQVDSLMESPAAPTTNPVDPAKIVEIHQFMLNELQTLPKTCPGHSHKTLALASQAVATARAQIKFGVPNELLDASTQHHFDTLTKDEAFNEVMMRIQMCISEMIR